VPKATKWSAALGMGDPIPQSRKARREESSSTQPNEPNCGGMPEPGLSAGPEGGSRPEKCRKTVWKDCLLKDLKKGLLIRGRG